MHRGAASEGALLPGHAVDRRRARLEQFHNECRRWRNALGALPLPVWGEGWAEGLQNYRETLTPHPTPLPMGERPDSSSSQFSICDQAVIRYVADAFPCRLHIGSTESSVSITSGGAALGASSRVRRSPLPFAE